MLRIMCDQWPDKTTLLFQCVGIYIYICTRLQLGHARLNTLFHNS